ncbi:MAG: sensor histidine kinase N-terminal domain-containing protein [Pseudomonadota bacterium]
MLGVASLPLGQGSLRRKLLFSLLAGAAVLTVSVFFMVLSVARQVAQESQDNILTASAISILDSARYSGGEITVDLPYSAFSMLGSVSDERVFYAIRLEGEFLSGYPELPVWAPEAADETGFRSLEFLGEEVRVATHSRSLSTDVGQQSLQVSVAQTLSGQSQIIAGITQTAIAIGICVFVLLVLLASTIAQNTVRPLDTLTASVSRRGPEDLRPVTSKVPNEMVPLVASLNRLMARLQTSLTRSEDFIAEAAHRVRTPLAVVRTKAEIIERKSDDADTRKTIGEMIHAIDESSRTAGQLLDHAMVTFRLDHLTMERIDLAQAARSVVDQMRPLSELKGIELSVNAELAVPVQADVILLQNAIQNLLDNAIKYSPSGASVKIEVVSHSDQGTLRVQDTGPGFPDHELDGLTERFKRGENAEGIVGSGLGLTIVREVMEAHGGEMSIGSASGGGACVELSFPLS